MSFNYQLSLCLILAKFELKYDYKPYAYKKSVASCCNQTLYVHESLKLQKFQEFLQTFATFFTS